MNKNNIDFSKDVFARLVMFGFIHQGLFLSSGSYKSDSGPELHVKLKYNTNSPKPLLQGVRMSHNVFTGKGKVYDPMVMFVIDFRKQMIIPRVLDLGMLQHKEVVSGKNGINNQAFNSVLVFLDEWVEQLHTQGYVPQNELAPSAYS